VLFSLLIIPPIAPDRQTLAITFLGAFQIPGNPTRTASAIGWAMIFVSAAPLLSATKSGMVGTAKLT